MGGNYNKALIYLISLSVVFSCQENQNPIQNNGVYIAGWNYTTVKYWGNGNDASLGSGRGLSIALSGQDIYISGYEQSSLGPRATYWKNKRPVRLTDGSKTSMAKSIALSGADVYVAGYEGFFAMLWKNGTGTPLNNVGDAEANGIAISGMDIYVAGAGRESAIKPFVAKYWKNGVSVELSHGSNNAFATSIAIDGTDIYVAGYELGIAKYWKNCKEIQLTNGLNEARAYAVSISANDVYIAGYEKIGNTMNAKYWKNGVPIVLSDGTVNETATAIAVSGHDVYVAGIEYKFNGYASYAKYWKNGSSVDLTDRKYDSEANSIALDF